MWPFCVILNEGKNFKIFLGLHRPHAPSCIWNKPNLLANTSLCSDSSQYVIIFSQSLVNANFFTSVLGPDVLINFFFFFFFFKDCIIYLIWAACVLFDFYFRAKTMIFSLKLYLKCLLHLLPLRNLF